MPALVIRSAPSVRWGCFAPPPASVPPPTPPPLPSSGQPAPSTVHARSRMRMAPSGWSMPVGLGIDAGLPPRLLLPCHWTVPPPYVGERRPFLLFFTLSRPPPFVDGAVGTRSPAAEEHARKIGLAWGGRGGARVQKQRTAGRTRRPAAEGAVRPDEGCSDWKRRPCTYFQVAEPGARSFCAVVFVTE